MFKEESQLSRLIRIIATIEASLSSLSYSLQLNCIFGP